MAASAPKQRVSQANLAQSDVGRAQLAFAQERSGFKDAARASAIRDDSDRALGQASADAELSFSGGTGEREASQTGRLASVPLINSLRDKASSDAAIEGQALATTQQNARIGNAINVNIGQSGTDNRALGSLAASQFRTNATRASIARQRSAIKTDVLAGLGGLGAGEVEKSRNTTKAVTKDIKSLFEEDNGLF